MENYILKLISGTTYKLYKGTTLVSDTDLTTLFGVAGEMYLSFDFNSGTPSDLTTFTITDSSDNAVISNSNLTDTIAEGKNYKATWSNSATAFDTFEELEGKALDESQLSFLMEKIKDAKEIREIVATSNLQMYDADTYPDGIYKITAQGTNCWISLDSTSGINANINRSGCTYAILVTYSTPDSSSLSRYLIVINSGLNYRSAEGAVHIIRKASANSGSSFVFIGATVDDLTYTDTYTRSARPLSAYQGKILADRIGTLSSLTTTAKTSAVAAINEVNSNLNDAAYVGDVLSTPSSVAYVATDNIQDGAVTAAKVAATDFTSQIATNETPLFIKGVAKAGRVLVNYMGADATHSNGALLFTLPSGARPSTTIWFPFTTSGAAYGNIAVYSSGEVYVNSISNSSISARVCATIAFDI